MEINERIKNRRLQLNLTLLDIANYIGVAEATVQRYESGNIKNLKRNTIAKLADVLQVSPAYLMGWVEDENETLSDPEDVIFYKGKVLRYDDLTEESQKALERFYISLKMQDEGRI